MTERVIGPLVPGRGVVPTAPPPKALQGSQPDWRNLLLDLVAAVSDELGHETGYSPQTRKAMNAATAAIVAHARHSVDSDSSAEAHSERDQA